MIIVMIIVVIILMILVMIMHVFILLADIMDVIITATESQDGIL